MYLKEAFRYQNFLSDLINETRGYLTNKSMIMTTTEEHLRSKANPDAKDEIIDRSADKPIDTEVGVLIEFMLSLVEQKEKLSFAINQAKSQCDFDIDAELANNKIRQETASVFAYMGKIKSTERMTTGLGMKFNAEGNQTSYRYDVKEVSKIDFDRTNVKHLATKFYKQADETSSRLDRAMIEIEVDFESPFDVNDSYEDALGAFVANEVA